MQTGVKPKATDSRDFIVISSDQVRSSPSDAEITDLLRAAAKQHSGANPSGASAPSASAPTPKVDTAFRAGAVDVDTTFRASAVNDAVPSARSTLGRRLMRPVAALVLACGIGAAALSWQTAGFAAKKVLLSYAPKWAIAASLPLDRLGLGPNSSPSENPDQTPAAQADTTTAAVAPAGEAPSVNNASANATPSASALSPDTTQQMQSMAHDLASAHQEIETLKANIAELKASQQQMARDFAKAASDRAAEQQAAKAKLAAARRLAAAPSYSPTASPAPAYRPNPPAYSAQAAIPAPSPQVAAQPLPAPVQLQSQDPGMPRTAPRPPMPLQ
jgi:hypothetical protein